jgi:hypothetical protein
MIGEAEKTWTPPYFLFIAVFAPCCMDELKKARLEKTIAWAGYFIVFVGALALVFWAWMREATSTICRRGGFRAEETPEPP